MSEDRLPGAGLARDRVQPLPQPELGPLDQEQVLDTKLEEHASVLMTEPDRFPGRSERLPSMAPPRILLCPQFSEVESAIAPQLSEWAEIAAFDARALGNEPAPEQGPQLLDRETVVRRALQELDRRGWDSGFVAGDAFGTATAARGAADGPGKG